MTQQMQEVKDRLLSDLEKSLDDIRSRYQTAQDDAWKHFQEIISSSNKKLLQTIEEINKQHLSKISENIDAEESNKLLIEFEEQLGVVSKEQESVSKKASDELKTALEKACVERDLDRDLAQQNFEKRLNTFFD